MKPGLMCPEFNDFIQKKLDNVSNTIPVIIINRSSAYVMGSVDKNLKAAAVPTVRLEGVVPNGREEFLREYRERLIASSCQLAESRKVFLVTPTPEMVEDVPKIAARRLLLGKSADIAITRQTYRERHEFILEAQNAAAQECGNITVLNAENYLCEGELCPGTENGRPLYYDDNHLTEYGNQRLVEMFAPAFSGGGDRSLH